MIKILTVGGFDDIRSRDIRFLQEASKLGTLTVRLLSDDILGAPKFPSSERAYILKALRFVSYVEEGGTDIGEHAVIVTRERDASVEAETKARDGGATYIVIADSALDGFPQLSPVAQAGSKTVAVSGCYDWLHSGHVRFFEEASHYGDLHVFLGSDATIEELKGKGHPQFPDIERQYVASSIRHVFKSLISRGSGMLDFADDVRAMKPDYFVVNEDGDRPSKRQFCEDNGIEYVTLKRTPAAGLPVRSSTALRGF